MDKITLDVLERSTFTVYQSENIVAEITEK